MAEDLLNMKLATILFGLLALPIITPRHCVANNFVLTANNSLLSPNRLNEGQFLTYGNYRFELQRGHCNLVLYDRGVAAWISNVSPPGSATRGCYAIMQTDGNFVLYDRDRRVIWSSRSWQGGSNVYMLLLQPDRNVVIYRGIWNAGTDIRTSTSILGRNSTAATVVTSAAAGGGDDPVMVN